MYRRKCTFLIVLNIILFIYMYVCISEVILLSFCGTCHNSALESKIVIIMTTIISTFALTSDIMKWERIPVQFRETLLKISQVMNCQLPWTSALLNKQCFRQSCNPLVCYQSANS